MKIGIVTIVDYTNYGNRLQNFALYQTLKKMGHDAITLHPISDKKYENGNHILWMKNLIARELCIFPEFAEKRFGSGMTRWANFMRWTKRIPTKDIYETERLDDSLNQEFDYFFVGSDQVWNPLIVKDQIYNFFLEFAEDSKKVAVSASIGMDELPEECKNRYTEQLCKFKYRSVRENAGAKILEELLCKEVPVIIDPTMMLTAEEWIQNERKPRVNITKPYVLKYYLGDKEGDRIDKWAKENGCQVYELMNPDVPELYSAGPGEFLSLIRHAKLVCSDSFHCIVFSILFYTPFLVYERKGTENYMTSRLDTLLETFELQDRWESLVNEEELLNIDYSKTEMILRDQRKIFMSYISSFLH